MPRVQANEIQLHYQEVGDGPEPLVLVHGYQSSHRVWCDVIANLPLDRFRVFAFDLRGAGESDRPDSGYDPVQYADDIAAAMSGLGVETFHYAGTSMGGMTGMQLALRHPQRLRSLILIAPAPADGWEGADWSDEFLRGMREARANPSLYRETAKTLWTRPPREELFKIYVEDAVGCSEGHLEESWQTMERMHIAARLGEITAPTMVVVGDRDFLRNDNLADAARIPNSALHVFYRVGHFIPWEVPEGLADVLTDFAGHGTAPAP